MGIRGSLGKALAPQMQRMAPDMTAGFVHEALSRAIHGVGPLPGAAHAADKQLEEQRGDVDAAIHEVIENHVRYAGVQGFATNLGGLVTAAVAADVSAITGAVVSAVSAGATIAVVTSAVVVWTVPPSWNFPGGVYARLFRASGEPRGAAFRAVHAHREADAGMNRDRRPARASSS